VASSTSAATGLPIAAIITAASTACPTRTIAAPV
jgi:hypothetical protein